MDAEHFDAQLKEVLTESLFWCGYIILLHYTILVMLNIEVTYVFFVNAIIWFLFVLYFVPFYVRRKLKSQELPKKDLLI